MIFKKKSPDAIPENRDDTPDVRGLRAIKLDPRGNEVRLQRHHLVPLLNPINEKERTEGAVKLARHLNNRMALEKQTMIGKIVTNKYTRGAALVAAGALGVYAGSVAVNGAPDWMGEAYNRTGELAAQGVDLARTGVEKFQELPSDVRTGLAVGVPIVGLGSIALAGRRVARGTKAQREERRLIDRNAERTLEGLRRGDITPKNERY